MVSNLGRDPERDKELYQKNLTPKKRTVPPEHNARRKEDLGQERTIMSDRKPPSPEVARRPHWPYLGTVALQEICHYQKTTELLIQKLTFAYLVWELSQGYNPRNIATESYSWQGLAIRVLQESSRYMLVGLLENANLCTIHMNTLLYSTRICSWPSDCKEDHPAGEGARGSHPGVWK